MLNGVKYELNRRIPFFFKSNKNMLNVSILKPIFPSKEILIGFSYTYRYIGCTDETSNPAVDPCGFRFDWATSAPNGNPARTSDIERPERRGEGPGEGLARGEGVNELKIGANEC